MVVIEDRHRHVVNSVGEQPAMPTPTMSNPTMSNPTMSNPTMSSRSSADARRQWVAPTWERRDTPMEVTMYAGQR
jgi:hypothetical protein